MGKLDSLACVNFLVSGTGACVLVGWSVSCPSGGRAASGGVFWNICELSMTFSCLSANGWDCFPVLLVVCHGVSSTGACWPLGGAGS